MNVLLLTGLLFFYSFFQTEFTYKHADLRKIYFQAANERKVYEQLVPHLAKYKGDDVLIEGFQASIEGLGAKYASGIYTKLKHIRNSAHAFERVISKDPQNPEIRFLRYTIEYHIPRYLLMSGHLQDDKKIILNNLLNHPRSNVDTEAVKVMRDYFLRGNHSTADEKKQLRNIKV